MEGHLGDKTSIGTTVTNYNDFVSNENARPVSILDKITTTGENNYKYDYNIHSCTLIEIVNTIEKLKGIQNSMHNGLREYDAEMYELIQAKIYKLINKI